MKFNMLSKLSKFFSFKSADGERYPYIVEIRPMLEKYLLKKQIRHIVRTVHIKKWHKVPHITLIYNFRLKRAKDKDIAKIIQNVASKYSVIKFYYDGFELRKGGRGYVLAFKIIPSFELKRLRKEMYNKLKPFIEQHPDVLDFNNADEFWFHATVGYRLSKRNCEFLRRKIQSFKRIYFPAFALRITLLKNSRIVYEYDVPTGKLLNRESSLSRKYYAKTVKSHRKTLQVEVFEQSKSKKQKIWLVSDTHFDHTNIIKYCARPFVDVRDMNKVLIKNWNTLVKKDDLVYFLGDMCFGKRSIVSWVSKLNGRIVFIRGDHDREKIGDDYRIIRYKGYRFLLIHNPERVESFNGWIIHGHKHYNDLINYPFVNGKKQTINVSVEVINYRPVSLDQILSLNLNTVKRIESVADIKK